MMAIIRSGGPVVLPTDCLSPSPAWDTRDGCAAFPLASALHALVLVARRCDVHTMTLWLRPPIRPQARAPADPLLLVCPHCTLRPGPPFSYRVGTAAMPARCVVQLVLNDLRGAFRRQYVEVSPNNVVVKKSSPAICFWEIFLGRSLLSPGTTRCNHGWWTAA